MRLSFNDEESFKEAVESFRFNNPASDPDPQIENSNSLPLEEFERNEDNITPSDPLAITLRRVGSSRSLSIQETWHTRSEDNQVCFNPPSNSEFTSANGV